MQLHLACSTKTPPCPPHPARQIWARGIDAFLCLLIVQPVPRAYAEQQSSNFKIVRWEMQEDGKMEIRILWHWAVPSFLTDLTWSLWSCKSRSSNYIWVAVSSCSQLLCGRKKRAMNQQRQTLGCPLSFRTGAPIKIKGEDMLQILITLFYDLQALHFQKAFNCYTASKGHDNSVILGCVWENARHVECWPKFGLQASNILIKRAASDSSSIKRIQNHHVPDNVDLFSEMLHHSILCPMVRYHVQNRPSK